MRQSAPAEHWPHRAPRALASSLLRAGFRCDAPVSHSGPQTPASEKPEDVQQPVERTRLRKTTFVQVQKGHILVVE